MFQSFLYNLVINSYKLLTLLASFFNKKAKQRIVGLRQNERLLQSISILEKSSKKWQLAWFHAASLGEFEQARPVLEQFKELHPHYKILVTFFSPSGFQIRKNYPLADFVLYLPFDLKYDAEAFIDTINPTVVFWVKYDYWRNFLQALYKRNVPVYLFSAIFRKNQPFFRWFGEFFLQPLRYFSHLFVQNEASKALLNSTKIYNVTVAGDTRFDRVADTLKSVREIEIVKKFKANRKLLVVGSAWEEDVECIKPVRNEGGKIVTNLGLEVAIVIAPHELRNEQIERWKIQFNGVRYSAVNDKTELSNFDTLLVDNIGLLSSIYKYADFAFIGGGFGKGLHNILEAATFGMPIFFGNKNYQKFKEATDLLKMGGAFAVSGEETFVTEFQKQLIDNNKAKQITADYVQNQTGATQIIMQSVANDVAQ